MQPIDFCILQGPDKPLPPVPGGGMGGSTPPPPPVPGGHMRTGSMNDLDRKNAIEVMELSDIHHPSCKLSQSRQGSFDDDADDVDDRSPLHDMSTHSHHSHHSCHSYSGMGHQGHPPPTMPVGPGGGGVGGGRRDSDLSDAFLSPEAYRATQAVEFIAEHLRNEDEYVQVSLASLDADDPYLITDAIWFCHLICIELWVTTFLPD